MVRNLNCFGLEDERQFGSAVIFLNHASSASSVLIECVVPIRCRPNLVGKSVTLNFLGRDGERRRVS